MVLHCCFAATQNDDGNSDMHWKNCSRSCLTAMHHPFFALAPPTWVKVLIFVIPNAFCNLASRTVPPMLKPASWKLYVLAVHICIAVFYYTTPPDPPPQSVSFNR